MVPAKIALAQMVCTRLCHDLGGPAGALSGALDLLEGEGDDALDVGLQRSHPLGAAAVARRNSARARRR